MTRVLAAVAAIFVIAFTQLATGNVALAHERRMVGPYQLVVGFLNEPAYAGSNNAIDFRVTDTRSTPAKNVEGLEKTVTVQVFQGGLTTSLSPTLATRFGAPGSYAAYFVPTRAGAYRFVFSGKIEQTDLKETFESGPGRFSDAESTTDLQYPDKVPTGAELGDRLNSIDQKLGSIQAFAIAALALAIVAVASGGYALRRPR